MTDQTHLCVTLRIGVDLVTVEVEGEIDQSNVAAFAAATRDLGAERQVVLDLSGITILGAAGLGAIAACAATCLDGGEPMTVRNTPHRVRRLLRLVRLDEVAHVEREVEADCEITAPPGTDELTLIADGVPAAPSAGRLAAALRERTVIAQAEGVLMARHGIGAEAAAADIRCCARARGLTVAQHCSNILAAAAERPAEDRIDQ